MGLSVPRGVSLIGFDDTRYAAVIDPPLTTIALPKAEIVRLTMERILDAVAGKDIGKGPDIVKPKLVVRGSTAPPTA